MEKPNSEDGQLFIKASIIGRISSLANFVRTHEKALANSLQMQRQRAKNVSSTSLISLPSPTSPANTSNSLITAFSLGGLNFMSHHIKPAQLTLTPHHLFYILSRLEELEIAVGPMNIRLKNLHNETSPANYVSFLNQPGQSRRRSDRDSLHSVSSSRSVMPGMGALWSSFGLGSSGGATKSEKVKAALEADLKYLYSAFTKLPSLRLSPDHRARLIRGYEEFPFDTAVPLFAFKNIQSLDIIDVDFRRFYGWDRLAEQLRLLTVKRARLDDPTDLITNIVLDDAERRRLRSTKAQHSPSLPWAVPSPAKSAVGRSFSDPRTPNRLAAGSPNIMVMGGDGDGGSPRPSTRSNSPAHPSPTRPCSSYRHVRTHSTRAKRSGSGSSNSSERSLLGQHGEMVSGLQSLPVLPAHKWRFLKYLSLADNSLTTISISSLLPLANSLRSLNLSSNLFAEIPDGLSHLTRLTSLDLSNCMIDSLRSLSTNPLPAITTLKLRNNRLTSLTGIERLLSLENLNAQDNRISDPMEAARLTGIPNIQRICVQRNPLTKRRDYRITIFNLFRNTPGYSEDIVIDDSGPGYTERKALQDRVPEGERPPVVRPVDVLQLSQPPKLRTDNPPRSFSSAEGVVEKVYAEHSAGSTRRRKVPRRRIVDLSREEERGSGTGQSNLTNFGLQLDNNEFNPPSRNDRPLPSPFDIRHTPTRAPLSFSSSPDDFRRRVEDLKLEVGDKWLSVLRAQGWDGSADLAANLDASRPPNHPLQTMQSPALVSGGRTLS